VVAFRPENDNKPLSPDECTDLGRSGKRACLAAINRDTPSERSIGPRLYL